MPARLTDTARKLMSTDQLVEVDKIGTARLAEIALTSDSEGMTDTQFRDYILAKWAKHPPEWIYATKVCLQSVTTDVSTGKTIINWTPECDLTDQQKTDIVDLMEIRNRKYVQAFMEVVYGG